MIKKIRILVVDDSIFMRKYISDMINGEPDMEVTGTAKDGTTAIEKIKSLNPDVITLDVEMPGKNGLEVLREIKKVSSSEVIMVSNLTTEGSYITIEALNIGAFDFVQKPCGTSTFQMNRAKRELLDKIRHAWMLKNRKNNIKKTGIKEYKTQDKPKGKIEAIVLGASTGGPKILYDVITNLPPDLRVPIFAVQHMPAGFTKAFAERLDINSYLNVVEATDKEPIKPGTVYIAPGGYHMLVDSQKIRLDTSQPIHGVKPAVDKLLISAAQYYKNRLICCIFTGMGKDGLRVLKL